MAAEERKRRRVTRLYVDAMDLSSVDSECNRGQFANREIGALQYVVQDLRLSHAAVGHAHCDVLAREMHVGGHVHSLGHSILQPAATTFLLSVDGDGIVVST